MNMKLLFLKVITIFCLSVCARMLCSHVDQFQRITPTTVLVYVCEDTPRSYRDMIIEEMQKIGSHEQVNALMYSTYKHDQARFAQAFMINKDAVLANEETISNETCWAQSAMDACYWAHKEFPSDRFVLIFCASNRDTLFEEKGIQRVVSYLCELREKPIDLVAFDVDMMACVDVACILASYANYLVASEGSRSNDWFPYDAILKYATKPVWFSACKMAFDMVNAYEERYGQIRYDYTLSAIDLSKACKISEAIDAIRQSVRELFNLNDPILRQLFIDSVDCCTFFEDKNYLDLGHFLTIFQTQIAQVKIMDKSRYNELRKNIAAAKRELKGCIIQCVYGAYFLNATGLTFCLSDYF